MTDLSVTERVLGGLWGAVVGDALGVPVEFQSVTNNCAKTLCKICGVTALTISPQVLGPTIAP